jgi:hypothetical protein
MIMSVSKELYNKKLSNGDAIESVEMFENIGAYLLNGKYVVSLSAATKDTIDLTNAKDASAFQNEPRQLLSK